MIDAYAKSLLSNFAERWRFLEIPQVQQKSSPYGQGSTFCRYYHFQKSKIKPKGGSIGHFPYDFAYLGANRCSRNIPAGNLQVNRMINRWSATNTQAA